MFRILLFIFALPVRFIVGWANASVEHWYREEYALVITLNLILYFALIFTGTWLMSPWLKS